MRKIVLRDFRGVFVGREGPTKRRQALQFRYGFDAHDYMKDNGIEKDSRYMPPIKILSYMVEPNICKNKEVWLAIVEDRFLAGDLSQEEYITCLMLAEPLFDKGLTHEEAWTMTNSAMMLINLDDDGLICWCIGNDNTLATIPPTDLDCIE